MARTRPPSPRRAPKILYWVELEPTQYGKVLPYRVKGGGKFTQLDAAYERQKDLARAGFESVLYQTKPIEWERVK